MLIRPTKDAKNLDEDLYDMSLIFLAKEDTPCPWDPEYSIEGGQFIIKGNLAAGGPGDGARCVITLPLHVFTEYYKLELPDGEFKDIDERLGKLGWERC